MIGNIVDLPSNGIRIRSSLESDGTEFRTLFFHGSGILGIPLVQMLSNEDLALLQQRWLQTCQSWCYFTVVERWRWSIEVNFFWSYSQRKSFDICLSTSSFVQKMDLIKPHYTNTFYSDREGQKIETSSLSASIPSTRYNFTLKYPPILHRCISVCLHDTQTCYFNRRQTIVV